MEQAFHCNGLGWRRLAVHNEIGKDCCEEWAWREVTGERWTFGFFLGWLRVQSYVFKATI